MQVVDDLTARFRAASSAWHDTAGWTDERLAAQVRADGIDVLFDLAGHTAKVNVKRLFDAGATEVHLFITAPTAVDICELGVDIA